MKKKNPKQAGLYDTVSVHYTVKRMEDDKILLDTTTRGDPVKFCLGKGEVIRALDLGISGMFVGGVRRITVPPEMGYESKGGRGTKGVNGPKGARGHWLLFDVKLVDVDV